MLKTRTTRRFERVPFFTEVIVAPLNGGTPTPARSFDISLAGVGLACSKPISVGQSVCLTFYLTTAEGVVAEGPVPAAEWPASNATTRIRSWGSISSSSWIGKRCRNSSMRSRVSDPAVPKARSHRDFAK